MEVLLKQKYHLWLSQFLIEKGIKELKYLSVLDFSCKILPLLGEREIHEKRG